ncbi:MAG: Tc toxin subunit A [Pseudomonas sp.]|uniref:Tc toxin subunit A n=1 Tax=Pseudomonas sp. TaxID=306 RepID=UPI0030F1A7B5
MPLTQPMSALENSCRLTSGTLAELGLLSLQDILTHSEPAFISRYAQALTRARAKAVYRSAQSARQQLIKLFQREGRQGSPLAAQANAVRAARTFGSVFDANSPTWSSQFPEKTTVVAPGSLGDSSSPASYAASLYALAMQLEAVTPTDTARITLASRRPELGDTLLSDVTVNQVLAKLDIVNRTLQSGLDNSKNNQALVKQLQLQGVLPSSVTQLPSDALLARLHYPGQALPYHEPHDQVVTGLAEQTTDLAALTQAVHADKPLFCGDEGDVELANRLLQQAAGLSPAQVALVIQPPAFASTASTATAFLAYNFGVVNADSLNQLPTFSQATALPTAQVLELFCAAGVGGQNTSVVASPNVPQATPAPYRYGAVFIHGGKLPGLALRQDKNSEPISIDGLQTSSGVLYDRYDRINRLVRLQRQTGLAFDQLDTLLVAAMHAEGQNNQALNMNTHTVRTLGFYQTWNAAYGLSAQELSAILYQLSPYATGTAVPPFDRLFNPRSSTAQAALQLDNLTFSYTATDGADALTVRQLCAGLNLSETEFLLLAEQVNNAQKLVKDKLVRSLPVVSALYRLSTVAKRLKLRVADMLALLQLMPRGRLLLLQLAGIAQLAELDDKGQAKAADLLNDLQALAQLLDWLKAQQLTVVDLWILLAPPPSVLAPSPREVALVNDINGHLGNIRLDANRLQNAGLPTADQAGVTLDWLALLSANSGGVSDQYGLIRLEDSVERNNAVAAIVAALNLSNSDKSAALVILSALLDSVLGSQQALLDTQVGTLLAVAHGTVSAMLSCLKLSSYALLNACQALNKSALTPADIPQTLMVPLNLLGRYSLLVSHYRLTPATLVLMSTLLPAFGGDISLSLSLLPVLADYVAWRQAASSEDLVLQYLRDANASPPLSASAASARLASMLEADAGVVQQAVDLINQSRAGQGLATTVPQVGHVLRLLDSAANTGLSINLLQQVSNLDLAQNALPDQATDDTVFANWRSAGLAVMATLTLGRNEQT